MTDAAPQRASMPETLEIYKLAVEMADRVSARRGTANAFFLTAETAFVTVTGLLITDVRTAAESDALSFTLAGVGVLLSLSWWLQLRSYRDLNRAKFKTIHDVEASLPFQLFKDEWDVLKSDQIPWWKGRYAELATVESLVPWVFAGLYLMLGVVSWRA